MCVCDDESAPQSKLWVCLGTTASVHFELCPQPSTVGGSRLLLLTTHTTPLSNITLEVADRLNSQKYPSWDTWSDIFSPDTLEPASTWRKTRQQTYFSWHLHLFATVCFFNSRIMEWWSSNHQWIAQKKACGKLNLKKFAGKKTIQ